MKKEAFSAFDASDYLQSEKDISAYLEAAMEDGDPQVLVAAMGDIVKARNVTKVARDAGLTREGIYKAFSPEGNPSFATVWKVANALNMKFSFRTKGPAVAAGRVLVAEKVGASRGRINMSDPEKMRHWSKELRATPTKIKSAAKQSTRSASKSKALAKGSVGRRTGR